ncbi:hypothetical protein N9W60_02730 [Flavobacteriaceae bacterium]|nr:hypothetical protein [Flavobacteriaceae bacterium]
MRFILSSLIMLSILSCSKESPVVTDPVVKYTLTVTSGVGGSVSSPGGSYNEGSSTSITATPNSEYVFVNWSNGSTDNPLSVTVNSNQTVTANFEKRKYPLTISITGSGTVSEEIISAGKSTTEYTSGSVIRLTANPTNEWVFTGWSGSVSSTDNPIELSINESKNVTVTFVNEMNNYFKIDNNTFSIDNVSSENYLNNITCNEIPSFYNHDLTFYSNNEDNEIYIEFFNNDSDQFAFGDYTSIFSYLNSYFQNNFNDLQGLEDHIENLSNQELYDLYSTMLCSNNNYRLIGSLGVEVQGVYYDIDTDNNFQLTVKLDNETYTVSMTGFIEGGGEKVELFYKGLLSFEVYDNNSEEINNLLSSNNQNEGNYDLNIIYDSKYNLDGTIKTEESKIGSNGAYLIGDNLLYTHRSFQDNTTRLFTSNNNYVVFDRDDGDPSTYPVPRLGYIINNDEGYFEINRIDTNTDNSLIYRFSKRKVNYDRLDSSSEITIDLTEFGPDEYFSKIFRFLGFSSDNLSNLYIVVEMIVQDIYTGDSQNTFHLIKYNPQTQDTIWSMEYPSRGIEAFRSGNTSRGFFNNKQNIIFYGFDTDNSSTWFEIYNSNTGELIYEDILIEFNSGGIVKFNGFYEDSNHLFLYGEYGFTSVINKSSFSHDIMYTYTYGNSDSCGNYPTITGFNNFNSNYVILSNVYKNDDNEGLFSIDIRDDQGNLLNNFKINNTGSPQRLFKLSDDSFLIVGSKEMCINETYGPRSRIIKFELSSHNDNKDGSNSNKFFRYKKGN